MTGSFKWTEDLHAVFVELCANEVFNGNQVGASLSKEAWARVQKELTAQKKAVCVHKQLKNHWEKMKDEYQTFKKLKFGESGLTWNESTKMIEAPELWWLQKIQVNPKFKKFRNKDLSLIMTYYETLFGNIVATGERARTADTYSAVNLETGVEFTDDAGDDGKEGIGDSEDNNMQLPPNLFPSTSLKFGKSRGSKRKRSGVEMICDCLDRLVAAMSSRSTQSTAAQLKAANDNAALKEAFDILNNMEQEQVIPGSDLYCFAAQVFMHDRHNRCFFLKAPSNDVRLQQLLYAFKAAGHNFGGQ